jgi:uncharacterized membrane protein
MSTDAALLSDISIFKLLDADERSVVAQQIDQRHFPAGTTIFRAGDRGGAMYVVRAGKVEVWLYDEDHQRVVLDVIEEGGLFGELSLLDDHPRSATATAVTDLDVLMIDREDLRLLFAQKPEAALDVLAVLGQRIRQTDQIIRSRAARNANEVIEEQLTVGQRLADRIAAFGGSWKFITSFAVVLIAWMMVNAVLQHPFDPFPFILLNLVLSSLAALQAPVIMMSQNRADAKDRIRSELDFQVNRKAELEIAELHVKLDEVRAEMLRAIELVDQRANAGEA